MLEGYSGGFTSPKVYEKNKFTKEDFEAISEMLQSDNLSLKYKRALLSLLKAYCKGLYCDECKGSKRTSSSSGVCEWNNDMRVSLPLNDGPLTSYPADCPVRQLLKKFGK